MNIRGSGESLISPSAISTPDAPAVADHSGNTARVKPSRKRLRTARSPSAEPNAITRVDESPAFGISTPMPPTTHLSTPAVAGLAGVVAVATESPSESLNSQPPFVDTAGDISVTRVAARLKI
jgi:hypothetical protein